MSGLNDRDRAAEALIARDFSRRGVLRLIAAGAGGAAVVTRGSLDSVTAQSGGEVRMLIRKPNTLNPIALTAGNEQQIARAIFGTLVKMNDEVQPVPDLAEMIEVTPDAKSFTFTLREGVAFNDGEPLTARDVVFTIERAVDSRTGSPWRGRLLTIAGAEAYGNQEAETISGIETPDDRTVVITLNEPNAAFLLTLGDFTGLGILPEHVLADIAPDQLINETFLDPSTGAGPFELVTYESDQFIELRPNPNWNGEPPLLDRVLLPIRTPAIALAEMERGELDIMRLPPEEVESARDIPNVTVVGVPSPSMDFLEVNTRRPYLEDKRVRQAMMYAIDRQGIVDSILQGEAELIHSPIFGPDWMGSLDQLNPYPHDVEQAQQLLSESGWDPDQEVVGLVASGSQPAYVPVIQDQLRDIGMNFEILQVDSAELVDRITGEDPDFDVFFNGGNTFRSDPDISASFYAGFNQSPAGRNRSGYANQALDDLYLQGRATTDLTERKDIYTEAALILNEDLPHIFLWSQNSHYAVNNRVQGFQAPGYIDNRLWNVEEWSIVE